MNRIDRLNLIRRSRNALRGLANEQVIQLFANLAWLG